VTGAPEYEYRGLVAASWDVLRPNAWLWPDVAFYPQWGIGRFRR
jgi:hypothetical protein